MKIVVTQEDLDEKYHKWLEKNGLEVGVHHGNSTLIFKKDGSDAWVNENGEGFKALSNQRIWEGGWNAGLNAALEIINSFIDKNKL